MGKSLKSNTTISQTVNYSMFSEEQKREIYYTAIRILSDIGADVYDDEALKIFNEAGCWIDGNRVKFPAGLVKWAVNVAPSEITIYNRNGNIAMNLGGRKTYYGPGPSNNDYIDPLTGERRKPLKKDKFDVAKVCDYLPNIDFVMDLGTPSDVTDTLADLHSFDAMLRNTTKPIIHWGFDIDQYQDIVDIASVVAGGLEKLQQKPFIALYSEPSSPLQHSSEAIAKSIFCAKNRLPVIYTPCVMAGATGPATLAGTISMGIAENLVGLIANQLIYQGTPFIMGGVYYIMDMITTVPSFGSPEFNAMQAAIAEVAHYMGIPVFGTAGCTDSCTIDGQAAAEAAMNILTAIQSGAQLVHDVGYIESGMTGSIEQLVMGDEIIAMVRRFIDGIKINDDSQALELINQVGPGGSFRNLEHTKKYISQIWSPELLDHQNIDKWIVSGGKSMEERLREKTIRIIEQHKVEELSDDVLDKIDRIIEKAEKNEKIKKGGRVKQ